MNLLIVNGYDKNGWGKLARYGLQPICEFYRDQLKIINSKIKTTFIYPSMNLDENYDESFIKSFTGIVWTGSSLNIYIIGYSNFSTFRIFFNCATICNSKKLHTPTTTKHIYL